MPKRPSRLQREIRQHRPFRSLGHEASVALLRTADMVDWRFAEALEPSGITPPQYNVLRILRGAGREGLCTLEVGERLVVRSPGITRMIDRLERKGWVRRERSTEDRREVRCFLTPKGRRLVDSLDSVVDRADRDAVRGLTPAEQRRLIRLLDRVRDGLG